MNILAIDTASNICSVAILDDDKVIKELHINDKNTHSIKLMPLIKQLFDQTHLLLQDMNLLTCNKGPGSFTGIRIGISTLKAFSDVTNIPSIGVSSLKSLAYYANVSNGYSCSLIDANHGNVYCGIFELKNGIYKKVIPYFFDSISSTTSVLQKLNKKITFCGNASIVYKDMIQSVLKKNASFIDTSFYETSAINIGIAAFHKFTNSNLENTLLPLYLKKSSAEIELENKLKE